MHRRALASVVAAVLGCSAGGAPSPATPIARRTRRCEDHATDVTFEASPGGVPEVDASWLADHACDVRIVDVRESDEVVDGVIEGAQTVPLASGRFVGGRLRCS